MKPILTAAQTKEADRRTISGGIPSLVLMERAAMSVVTAMQECDLEEGCALILCGTGNNGGDGLAVARILCDLGQEAQVLAVGDPERYSDERRQQEDMIAPYGVPFFSTWEEIDMRRVTVIVDALFGIGLSRPVSGDWADCIEKANASGLPVVAVDMPSGIHTDTGAVLGTAIRADITVTFSVPKAGLLLYPGKTYAGELFVQEIGIRIPDEPEFGLFRQITEEDLELIPERDESGNKGTFGKILVIAGSHNVCGAARLSAEAALRSGAGMVKIYTEEANRVPLATSFPEALLTTYDEWEWTPDDLKNDLAWADTILIGPGIGCGSTAQRILNYVLEHATHPLILDADALNLLAGKTDVLRDYPGPCTITPHCMEMSRLTGLSVSEIKADPRTAAGELAASCGAAVVLKDASTVIAEPDGYGYLYAGGTSALATAGSGDVLAGLLAGLTAQHGDSDLPVAALGVCLHGTLGELAAEDLSKAAVLAGDLTDYLPLLM